MENWFINGEIEKWQIPHVREIDKKCKGAPKVLHLRPYRLALWAYLLDLPFLPFVSIFGHVGFNILPFRAP